MNAGNLEQYLIHIKNKFILYKKDHVVRFVRVEIEWVSIFLNESIVISEIQTMLIMCCGKTKHVHPNDINLFHYYYCAHKQASKQTIVSTTVHNSRAT